MTEFIVQVIVIERGRERRGMQSQVCVVGRLFLF
jgi:hypothetical protein